jgi:hypothetical protein
LFPKDFVPELNTKNLGNSPNILTMTHMTLSTKQFRNYGILMIYVTTEFCFWNEQRRNGSSISSLRLAETLEVLHNILEDNSLSFSMVYQTAPNGWGFASYGGRKLNQLLNQHFWADCTFLYKIDFW